MKNVLLAQSLALRLEKPAIHLEPAPVGHTTLEKLPSQSPLLELAFDSKPT